MAATNRLSFEKFLRGQRPPYDTIPKNPFSDTKMSIDARISISDRESFAEWQHAFWKVEVYWR